MVMEDWFLSPYNGLYNVSGHAKICQSVTFESLEDHSNG